MHKEKFNDGWKIGKRSSWMDVFTDTETPLKPVTSLERVNDLIGWMALKEKVAQLTGCMTISRDDVINQLKALFSDGVGTISYLNSSLSGCHEKDIKALKEIQRFFVAETRLGIPALAHSEEIAGAQIPGATTFPQRNNKEG